MAIAARLRKAARTAEAKAAGYRAKATELEAEADALRESVS